MKRLVLLINTNVYFYFSVLRVHPHRLFFHTIYVDGCIAYIIFLNIFEPNIICALHYIYFMISETDDDVYY